MVAEVEFGLLGPLQVRGQLPVRAGKQRVILASLLLQPNRPVSIDELIDRLWGEEPVGTARATVHQYVMRLRQALGETGDLIRTATDGYVIEVAAETIDVHRFDDLVRRGRRAGEQGDLSSEARSLTDALALWRGAALVDIPSQRLQLSEVPRLNEQRLQVIERRMEVELLLGRHVEVIAELRTLTNDNPLREGFWEQLIEALHRSGRQAEALAAFQTVQRVMDEELGVAPGPRLRELQAAIIAERANRPGAVADRQVPRQLPPDIVTFAGRTAELQQLIDALDNNAGPLQAPVVVALHGPGGIGKSTLAIRAAHAIADRFPDGQLYVDLQGSSPGLEPLTTVDVLGRFLRASAPEADLPTDEGELAARFRSGVAGRRMLLLLDNAAGIKQLMPLLPASATCAVLITSRQQLTTLPAVHLAATPLSSTQAIELLALLAGHDRVLAESDAAAEVARWCGHSPLALRIVGARLAGNPDLAIATLARRLRAGHWRDLEVDDLSVRSSFDVSYAELVAARTPRADAAKAFRMIGLLQVPEITPPVVAALLSATVDEAELALDCLRKLHLMEPTGTAERYRMHDLLRLYSRDLARQFDTQEERDTAVRQAHEWYLAAITEGSQLIKGNRWDVDAEPAVLGLESAAEAVDWLDAELSNIVALAGQAAELPALLGQSVNRLVPMVANTLQKRGRWHEAETLTRLAAETARQLGDQEAEAAVLAGLSACNWRAGRLDEAEENLQRSLVLRRATGDKSAEDRALQNLGWLSHRKGQLPEAIGYFEQSVQVLTEYGPQIWLAVALHNLGEAYFESHDYRRAEECLEQALAIRRDENDAGGLSITLVALGRTYGQRGRYDEALAVLSEGVESCREAGNREDEWVALLVRTEFLLRMGRPAEAETVIAQALAITRRLENGHGEGMAQRQLGKALAAMGHPEEADAAQQRAKAIFADLSVVGDKLLEDFFTKPPPLAGSGSAEA